MGKKIELIFKTKPVVVANNDRLYFFIDFYI